MKGEIQNTTLDQIDYKNATLHLRDYFTFVQELWVNESAYRNSSRFVDHKVVFDGFYREENFLRCFLLKSEIENHLESIVIYYDMQKLDHEWGKHVKLPLMYLKVHYPGQFLLGEDAFSLHLVDERKLGRIRFHVHDIVAFLIDNRVGVKRIISTVF